MKNDQRAQSSSESGVDLSLTNPTGGVSRRALLKAGGLLAVSGTAAALLAACASNAVSMTSAPGSGAAPSGAAPSGAAPSGAAAVAASYTMWALSDTVKVMKYFSDKYQSTMNKNFTLSITEVPAGLSHRAKILSAAAAGQLPDIMDDSMNYGSDFANYNMFEPLDQYLGTDPGSAFSLYPEVWAWANTANIPGYPGQPNIFGFPYAISVFVPTYRVDFFKQAGVTFPTTWEELVSAGQALTKAPDRYALSIPTSGDLMDEFHPFLMQAGASYMNADFTKTLVPRDAAYKGFQFYRDLAIKYQIAPKQAPDRFASDPVQRLASGQVAMTTLSTLSISAFQTTVQNLKFGPDADWFVGKFWSGPGGPGGYFNANALHVRRGVNNPAPAVEFFKWMAAPEQQLEMYKKFNRPPINTAVWPELKDDLAWPIYEESIKISKRQGGFKGWKLGEFVIDRGVERIVLGGEQVEPVVDQTATDMLQAFVNA